MVGLVLGGIVLILLLLVGLALLGSNADEDVASPPTTVATPSSSRATPATGGPTTSVAGTGPASRISAASITKFIREKQLEKTPTLTVGAIVCPPSPYRVGHVIVCQVALEDATVLYRVDITAVEAFKFEGVKPIIDTDKAETLMEAKEPGATADCGSPRIRQLDVGSTLTCRTEKNIWDITVGPDGELTGSTR